MSRNVCGRVAQKVSFTIAQTFAPSTVESKIDPRVLRAELIFRNVTSQRVVEWNGAQTGSDPAGNICRTTVQGKIYKTECAVGLRLPFRCGLAAGVATMVADSRATSRGAVPHRYSKLRINFICDKCRKTLSESKYMHAPAAHCGY
jgi:hypothetical protein